MSFCLKSSFSLSTLGQYDDYQQDQNRQLIDSDTTVGEIAKETNINMRQKEASSVFDELSSKFNRNSQEESSLFAQLLDEQNEHSVKTSYQHPFLVLLKFT